MFRKLLLLSLSAILLLALVTACTGGNGDSSVGADEGKLNSEVAAVLAAPGDEENIKLVERRDVYNLDTADELVYLYLTITPDNKTNEPPVFWDQLSEIRTKVPGEVLPRLSMIMQEGDASGPKSGMYGYGAVLPNGEITIRGASTRKAAQKSYKIDLTDEGGLWREHKTVNLIKHAYETSRVRNKLSFDLFTHIPNMTSLRTQFVHLYVKDLTQAAAVDQFVDYGLYTQIEQPNKRFLRMHGLDSKAHLYKATQFEFLRYADKLKLETDPTYDETMFSSVLESRGDKDHTKLLAMLDAVNDTTRDIDEVFDQYFDRDNFLTWMSVNILFDNMDTNSQNFMLYSPLNSEKWFLLPWDYDGGWGFTTSTAGGGPESTEKWRQGIANYWNVTLMKRLFKKQDNIDQLERKMEEVLSIVSPDLIQSYLDKYEKVAPSVTLEMPDIGYLPGTIEDYHQEWASFPDLPRKQFEKFKASLELPMPFFVGEEIIEGDKLVLKWERSYDLQGDDLTYHVQVGKTPDFQNPIVDDKDVGMTMHTIELPGPGRYFWRISVQDAKGNEMHAYGSYKDTEKEYYGVKVFYVEEDATGQLQIVKETK